MWPTWTTGNEYCPITTKDKFDNLEQQGTHTARLIQKSDSRTAKFSVTEDTGQKISLTIVSLFGTKP